MSDKQITELAKEKQALTYDQNVLKIPLSVATIKEGSAATRDTVVHDITNSAKKNFDQRVYMFPTEYNELRKELFHNWPKLWELVGWPMAYKAELFVEIMNDALDMAVVCDSEQVGFICKSFLDELRRRRGVQ